MVDVCISAMTCQVSASNWNIWVLSHMENILSKMQPKWSSIIEQSNSYNVGHFCFLDFSFQNIVTTFAKLVKNNQHADVVCINTEKLNRRNSTR